jgi:hypothetical protein
MYAAVRLVKRFEDLTTVDILANYESKIFLFIFPVALKSYSRIRHHLPDCEVCNCPVIQENRPLECRETKTSAKKKKKSKFLYKTSKQFYSRLASHIHAASASYIAVLCGWLLT